MIQKKVFEMRNIFILHFRPMGNIVIRSFTVPWKQEWHKKKHFFDSNIHLSTFPTWTNIVTTGILLFCELILSSVYKLCLLISYFYTYQHVWFWNKETFERFYHTYLFVCIYVSNLKYYFRNNKFFCIVMSLLPLL